MTKRIVVCADGTWNRPEEDIESDVPTNVLRMARAISPKDSKGDSQQVFYDWGLGSYHGKYVGGISGRGIHKNIMDGYRYIVQNYTPGAEIFLFGFSRGAYTVRCLCGLINNCGVLKRPDARRIEQAFDYYKMVSDKYHPEGEASVDFRSEYSHKGSRVVRFVGVWDTVGALGIPFSLLGLLDRTDEFYDTKIGPKVDIARQALAIDEKRVDFKPTLWQEREGLDLKQTWFAGVHSDVGGGYSPDGSGRLTSDFALKWMIDEAKSAGLDFEGHLSSGLKPSVKAPVHRSLRHIYRVRKRWYRPLHKSGLELGIHKSVHKRWLSDAEYRPKNLVEYLEAHGWPDVFVE